MATGEARRDLWRYSCLAVAGTGVVAIGVARGRPASGPAILANSLLVVIAWAAGWAVRSTRQLAASRVSLEHEQAARRLSENRLAMSDVLHDRVGHTLVGVLRQLEAAQALFEVDPVGAGTLIERVTGRVGEAMGEVSAMVVQNQELPAARAELAPTPGGGGVLGDTLGRWIGLLASAGVVVQLTLNGDIAALPPVLAATAAGVLAEALANLTAHSHTTRADICIRVDAHRLTVTVSDPGPSRGPGNTSGSGLGRQTERVAAAGQLHAGPDPHGGFEVRAELPLPAPVEVSR